jgi:hypothetical protein
MKGRKDDSDGHNACDADWQKVETALRDPEWDFRTIESMASDTGLSIEQVESALNRHATEVRKAFITDRQGRILYTLADKPVTMREFWANTRAFIAKTSAT